MRDIQTMARLFTPRQESIIRTIDGRLKLFWLLMTIILSLTLQTFTCLGLLFCGTLIYSLLAKIVRQHLVILKYAVIFSLSGLIVLLLVTNNIQMIRAIAVRLFARICIMSSSGILFAQSISPREILQVLEQMRIPRIVVFPLTTALRFIPALLKEIREIMDALKLRGITPGLRLVLRHPGLCYRSILIPVTIRSITISSELAAVAELRGMGNPDKSVSLYTNRMTKYDYLFFCSSVVFFAAITMADCYFRGLL